MTIRYCGVELIQPDGDLLSWMAEFIDPSSQTEWLDRSWPGNTLEHVGFRGVWPKKPMKINTLRWPVGASRFAYGHFLVDEPGLASIRQSLALSPGAPGREEFYLSDGQKELTTQLGMLPARPLARVTAQTPGLYLLTLVDDRYFWWFVSAEIVVEEGSGWGDLFDQISTALGVSISVDSVGAEWLGPPVEFTQSGRPLPILLDAVSASVGQRIVRHTDGTVLSMNADTSLELHLQNLTEWQRLAGDQHDLLGV